VQERNKKSPRRQNKVENGMYQKEGKNKKGLSGEKKINTKIVGMHKR